MWKEFVGEGMCPLYASVSDRATGVSVLGSLAWYTQQAGEGPRLPLWLVVHSLPHGYCLLLNSLFLSLVSSEENADSTPIPESPPPSVDVSDPT